MNNDIVLWFKDSVKIKKIFNINIKKVLTLSVYHDQRIMSIMAGKIVENEPYLDIS